MQFFILKDLDYSNSKINLKNFRKIVIVPSTFSQLKVLILKKKLIYNIVFLMSMRSYCICHVYGANI